MTKIIAKLFTIAGIAVASIQGAQAATPHGIQSAQCVAVMSSAILIDPASKEVRNVAKQAYMDQAIRAGVTQAEFESIYQRKMSEYKAAATRGDNSLIPAVNRDIQACKRI